MSLAALAYPFLFISIFFESFVLVTFLSRPARSARARGPATDNATLPRVAMIVPSYNEGETVAATCDSLLALDYPADKLEVVLVDDGSTDDTASRMERFAGNPRVIVIHKENGGKHTALNAGIAATSAEIIGCLDADSFVEPDALREMVPCFAEPKVAAVTAAMSVHKPRNLIEHMQNAEYIFGITLRHALASINGIYVTPGPFSLYRRATLEQVGGFRYGHQTEDMEMALRLQQSGYAIENAPRARVYTNAPTSVLALVKQRTRWTSGFIRNICNEYRGLVLSRAHGALGMIVLPIGITAIASGMLLFCLALFSFVKSLVNTYRIHAGVPISYAFSGAHTFDWFYLPGSVYLLLAAATVLMSVAMITIGKRLSRTPGSLSIGIASYLFLYGLIAPLWLLRASSDIALGKRRGWR